MPKMIKKGDGNIVPFDRKKVANSLKRVGADKKTSNRVLKVVEEKLQDNMTTYDVYQIVREELKKTTPVAAARYNLRQAILRLGPAGFHFEKYVAAILKEYGYITETPESFQGACVSHETDVTAEKEGRTAFIEAKFRHDPRGHVDIKDTMSTWARFLDLVDGSKLDLCPHFDEAWIVTNARFSDQSLKYGHCKNMVLIGWNHPEERSFAQMVDHEALYPITVIEDLKKVELDALADMNMMLCKDITDESMKVLQQRTQMSDSRVEEIKNICKQIVDNK